MLLNEALKARVIWLEVYSLFFLLLFYVSILSTGTSFFVFIVVSSVIHDETNNVTYFLVYTFIKVELYISLLLCKI